MCKRATRVSRVRKAQILLWPRKTRTKVVGLVVAWEPIRQRLALRGRPRLCNSLPANVRATTSFNGSFKVHCHGDFAIFWSKLLKYLTKNLFCNMTLLLQHRERNIKVFLVGRTNHNQFLATCLKCTEGTNFFKLQSTSILAIRSQT